MTAPVAAYLRWFRQRCDDKCKARDLYYPWWVAVFSALMIAGAAVVGAAQRDQLFDVGPATLAALLVATPYIVDLFVTWWVPWWITTPVVGAGTLWMMSIPVGSDEAIDLAPVALCFLVGCVAATEGTKQAFVAAAASIVLLGLGDASGDLLLVYRGEVVVGLAIGMMLRWQSRALRAEHVAREEEHERATLAERQRVAREIHDLVAHSLSVTMLHVTGARRALEQDADVPDAIEALTEAERIGRQAMADIRRTVGVLREGESQTRPLPGVADVDELVEGFRTAGLEVEWTTSGDLARLDQSAGLSVYRVVQESLANVAKHAPGAPASASLVVGTSSARLVVTNPVPVLATVGRDGSGLAGMASRAEQLGGRVECGVQGRDWRVELDVPLTADEPTAHPAPTGHQCALTRVLPT